MALPNRAGQALRDRKALEEALAAHPLFGGLSVASRQDLIKRASIHHLDVEEILYSAGAPATEAFVVLQGGLQIEYPSEGMLRGYVSAMVAAPSFIGVCQLLHRRPFSGTAVALLPVVALGLGREALESAVLEQSSFALAAYREVTLHFLQAIDTWKHQVHQSPASVLSRYLASCVLLRAGGGVSAKELLAIRQVDIGRATGLRRETINRLLKRWGKEGWLKVEARGLSAIDVDALLSLVDTEPRTLIQLVTDI